MPKDEPEISIDLAELNRLNKLLLGFFIAYWVCLIALFIPKSGVTRHGAIDSGFAALWIVSAWGYLINLGRMAVRLKKSWIVWCGLTIIFQLFGVLISYPLMQNEIQQARFRFADN